MKLFKYLLFIPLLFSFAISKNNTQNNHFLINKVEISRNINSDSLNEFVSYWNDDFRINNPEVCNITYEAYSPMYEKYQKLSKEDKVQLNEIKDNLEPDYSIGDIIKTLVAKYYPNNSKSKTEKKKLDQSAIIIIAVVVALVGATSISILYILKNQKVIK